ncbi:hypothetical protein AVDCRST_MAG84-3191 [uncultured Microcoleus sp.]|uniref:Uncharacterized protein n=1 Tax=uncultured Microcoleus sp. TaxID=259945 RepID=A0A6J4MFQ1_9CYAN|nr:hypothetical protein AVDCRST_MAG84-3191 [uncultured Microcoleus sp.]
METVAYFPQISVQFSSVRSPKKIRPPKVPQINILEFLMRIA